MVLLDLALLQQITACIFAVLKREQIQVFLLALIVILPMLVASISTMGDVIDKYALIELSEGEEEQNEERGSEEKEAKDAVEEYLLQDHRAISDLELVGLDYFARSKAFSTVSSAVLTPPPEYI